jgi:shikimate dehydrogenase
MVIGSPIAHSLSPAIFKFVASLESSAFEYEKKEVRPQELESFLKTITMNQNILGLNVTLPLKEEILSHLDEVSSVAKFLGAVNVVHQVNGKLVGHNTDVIGIEKTLMNHQAQIKGLDCLVFGAGGSSKAVNYVLGKLKARSVTIYNPRSNRGVELVQKLHQMFPETEFTIVSDLNQLKNKRLALIVNTTPVGMGKSDEKAHEFFSSLTALKTDAQTLAFDLIYTPSSTPFLQKAESLGMRSVGGLGMLVDQALATWKIWIGPLHDEHQIHLGLMNYLQGILRLKLEPRPMLLTGFMGVGKSSIAKHVAQLCGREFVDTDRVIEARAGLSVKEIFAQKGEEYFRTLESQTVLETLSRHDVVVALGGGALMNAEILSEVKKKGLLVYLSAEIENLLSRLSQEGNVRPLLAHLSEDERKEKIRHLLQQRGPIYEQAEVMINTSTLSETETTYALLSHLGMNS